MNTCQPFPKPSKPTKPRPSTPSRTSTSSLPSHFPMIELKQRIISSITKLSDRDTHHLAVQDLETIIKTISPDCTSMLLTSLYDASNDPKPFVKKEILRLLTLVCTCHANSTTSPHLPKVISHVVKRLKDTDSSVREACRDAIGELSGKFLRGECNVLGLFVNPLFEAMSEQSKTVQSGAAMCLAKMVECAVVAPVVMFHKLCRRICKYLNYPHFLAKAALLSVVAIISQVGAISSQNVPALLQSIHDCLGNSDWATRKAAADTLSTLASHSSHLIVDRASSTITTLEACRFDKVKPVRDSMTEALQLWKKVAEKGSGIAEGSNAMSNDEKGSEAIGSAKDVSNVASETSESLSNAKASSISEKTVGILKKRAPSLTDKELNPDFFQKLETRGSDDLPVEVVVPRKFLNSSNSKGEEELEPIDTVYKGKTSHDGKNELGQGPHSIKHYSSERGVSGQDNYIEQGAYRRKDLKMQPLNVNGRIEVDQSGAHTGFPRSDANVEGSYMNNKGNWFAIQRQLSLLERQQAHLMNMLQDFMSGSHDSMVALENRVRGLERVVEDMVHDLAISSGRRTINFMVGFKDPSSRPLGKYSSVPDYTTTKLGRIGDGWGPFADRFVSSETWDSYHHGSSRNWSMGPKRVISNIGSDGRPSRSGNDCDQVTSRRAWERGPGPTKLGEGPSARSVWQASKEEATLEAIRVAGEDNGTSRPAALVAIPEMTADAIGNDNARRDQEPIRAIWRNVMDVLHMGDVDAAYSELLATGDDVLLVKLIDRSGPVLDQLSRETSCEVLQAIGRFLLEQSLFDIGLSWMQQLIDLVMENGPDVLGIPLETKRVLLLNLHEASSLIDPPQEWEGTAPDQLMLQLASAWGIDMQQLEK